jgi:hypothetical protein
MEGKSTDDVWVEKHAISKDMEGKSTDDVWVEKHAISKDTKVYVDHCWAGIRTCNKLLPDITAVLQAPNHGSQKKNQTPSFSDT